MTHSEDSRGGVRYVDNEPVRLGGRESGTKLYPADLHIPSDCQINEKIVVKPSWAV